MSPSDDDRSHTHRSDEPEERRVGASPYRMPGRKSSSKGSQSEGGSVIGIALLIVAVLVIALLRHGAFR
jgi:hypothetical protein